MLGTLLWRIKEATAVLLGQKKTATNRINSTEKLPLPDLTKPHIIADQEIAKFIDSLSIEFCFCEFGEQRVNAGGNALGKNRLEPSLSSLKHFFPKATFTVYSDFNLEVEGTTLKRVEKVPFPNDNHPRYGYRIADYFKFKSLTESKADFVCVIDSDMLVVSEDIYRLVYLTHLFGACTPFNTRNLLKNDMKMSLDTLPISDLSKGFGHSYNQSPMTLWKGFEAGKKYYEACCNWMVKEPSRASRVMWKAALETGYSPYLLPQQFCVCEGDVGAGHEVMLHLGHKKVAEYYNIKNGVS